VAGHISDFAEACREIIPYHCDASTWERAYVLGGFAMIGLALATIVFLGREQWLRWAVVLALPAVGLVIGLVADKLDVPELGELAQGVNVYRLMLIFLPFALWGILTPLFADLTPRARWVMLGLVLGLGQFALQLSWAVDSSNTLRASLVDLVFGGALVLGCVALTVPEITRHPRGVVRLAGLGGPDAHRPRGRLIRLAWTIRLPPRGPHHQPHDKRDRDGPPLKRDSRPQLQRDANELMRTWKEGMMVGEKQERAQTKCRNRIGEEAGSWTRL